MAVKHDTKLEVTCTLAPSDIELNCEVLTRHGPAGTKAIEILRELGAIVSRLDEAAGEIRLVVSVVSDGKNKSAIDLVLDGAGVKVPNASEAWELTLDKVHLSTRARGILEQLGAKTLGDIALKSLRNLRAIYGCGWHTVHEIERMLAAHGLSLAMKEKPAALPA